jgi:hypothetical protein
MISTIILGQTNADATSTSGPIETLRFLGTRNESEEIDVIEIE